MPYLEANRRTSNTVFHVSLNPSPEDKLTNEQLREIANEYMQKMGYGEQPYIVFKHKDIDRGHLMSYHYASMRTALKSVIHTTFPVLSGGFVTRTTNKQIELD